MRCQFSWRRCVHHVSVLHSRTLGTHAEAELNLTFYLIVRWWLFQTRELGRPNLVEAFPIRWLISSSSLVEELTTDPKKDSLLTTLSSMMLIRMRGGLGVPSDITTVFFKLMVMLKLVQALAKRLHRIVRQPQGEQLGQRHWRTAIHESVHAWSSCAAG